jgi:isoleucyl-tRNA synthetase
LAPNSTYVKVQAEDGWTYYLAEEAMKQSLTGKAERGVGRLKGADMIGWQYSGPFDELPAGPTSLCREGYTHRVIPWKEVGAEEGTGIVHIAPGCGAEDFELGKEYNLPVLPRWTRTASTCPASTG